MENVMHKLFAVISLVSVLLAMEPAKAGPVEDAAAVRTQWEQVYNSGDVDKFVALYTKDSLLFGSTAQLFTGSEGARAYFSKLPPGIKAKMGDQQAIAVGPNVLLSSGFADFTLKDGYRAALSPDVRDRQGRRPMADRSAPRLILAEVIKGAQASRSQHRSGGG
jgi:hypothetical protein